MVPARRTFLNAAVLSGAAVALLAGRDALAASQSKSAPRALLRMAASFDAGAELEAIAAYEVAAGSGLLQKPVLSLAQQFQGHHREHADLLAKTVSKLGGKPVAARARYDFPTDKLRNQADVLRFAAQLEKGAVSAYLNAVPIFANRDLAKAAGSILGDEAMHWAVLRQAVGENPVPDAFVS
jgi:rubrerythrin